jgi:hypothetical protein
MKGSPRVVSKCQEILCISRERPPPVLEHRREPNDRAASVAALRAHCLVVFVLSERRLAPRLSERKAEANKADQHHGPGGGLGNRRGDAGDAWLVERAKARRGRKGDGRDCVVALSCPREQG